MIPDCRAGATKRHNESTFVVFNVTYVNGTVTSKRKVPAGVLGGLHSDELARTAIEAQDRQIGLGSGRPRGLIKSVARTWV
jgi:hypothetical protein